MAGRFDLYGGCEEVRGLILLCAQSQRLSSGKREAIAYLATHKEGLLRRGSDGGGVVSIVCVLRWGVADGKVWPG